MPTPAVRAAGSTGRVVVGEHYTELGTCCIDDGRQNLGDALIFGRIDKHRPGMQSVVMPCVSPAGLAFGIRQVRRCALLGGAARAYKAPLRDEPSATHAKRQSPS